jgi:hypothetical protein
MDNDKDVRGQCYDHHFPPIFCEKLTHFLKTNHHISGELLWLSGKVVKNEKIK